MNQPSHHLAQINIARMLAPLDDPLMAGFVEQLDPVNALADRSLTRRGASPPPVSTPTRKALLMVVDRIQRLLGFYLGAAHAVFRPIEPPKSCFDGPKIASSVASLVSSCSLAHLTS